MAAVRCWPSGRVTLTVAMTSPRWTLSMAALSWLRSSPARVRRAVREPRGLVQQDYNGLHFGRNPEGQQGVTWIEGDVGSRHSAGPDYRRGGSGHSGPYKRNRLDGFESSDWTRRGWRALLRSLRVRRPHRRLWVVRCSARCVHRRSASRAVQHGRVAEGLLLDSPSAAGEGAVGDGDQPESDTALDQWLIAIEGVVGV